MPTKVIYCPVCGTDIKKRVVGDGVEVDYCDAHGIWLDAGELEYLLGMKAGSKRESKSVDQQVTQGPGRAAVLGAGFHVGSRLASGVLDAMLRRKLDDVLTF